MFPSSYCEQDQTDAYGLGEVGKGCVLSAWLTPDACILPVPVEVDWQLSQWERQSRPLAAGEADKVAIRWVQ